MADRLGTRWARYFQLVYTRLGIIHSIRQRAGRKLMSGRGMGENALTSPASGT